MVETTPTDIESTRLQEKKEGDATNMMKELGDLVDRVKAAQKIYSTFTQEKVDTIFRTAALAAANARIPLAKMAAEESGMGVVEDKVIKVRKIFMLRFNFLLSCYSFIIWCAFTDFHHSPLVNQNYTRIISPVNTFTTSTRMIRLVVWWKRMRSLAR